MAGVNEYGEVQCDVTQQTSSTGYIPAVAENIQSLSGDGAASNMTCDNDTISNRSRGTTTGEMSSDCGASLPLGIRMAANNGTIQETAGDVTPTSTDAAPQNCDNDSAAAEPITDEAPHDQNTINNEDDYNNASGGNRDGDMNSDSSVNGEANTCSDVDWNSDDEEESMHRDNYYGVRANGNHTDDINIIPPAELEGETPTTLLVVGLENVLKALMCTAGLWLKRPELFAGLDYTYAFHKAATFILFGPPGCGKGFASRQFAYSIPGCKHINVSSGTDYGNRDLLAKIVLKEAKNNICVVEIELDDLITLEGDPREEKIYEELHKKVTDLLKLLKQNQCRCVVFLKVNIFHRLPQSTKDEFGTHIYMPLPNDRNRPQFIKECMQSHYDDCSGLSDQDYEEISNLTAGWPYRDIEFAMTEEMDRYSRAYTYDTTYCVVIPPGPCSDCIEKTKKDLYDRPPGPDLENRKLCRHQKVHPCTAETLGAFKGNIWNVNNDHFFLTSPSMEEIRDGIRDLPIILDPPVSKARLQYYENYMTSHGHYTAYRGNTKELDFQPPYTNEQNKSLNAVYSLKQIARMEVFKRNDDKDFEVLWGRVSQLPIPKMLRLYIMNENI